MAPLKLWGAGTRATKVQLVAALCGVPTEMPPFTFGVTNKTPEFLAMNPLGKVRVGGALMRPDAARHARHALRGWPHAPRAASGTALDRRRSRGVDQ